MTKVILQFALILYLIWNLWRNRLIFTDIRELTIKFYKLRRDLILIKKFKK